MERLGVEKLNGQNCCSWKTKVEFLLIREDLWRFVTGTKQAPRRAAASGSGSTGAASAGQVLNAAEIEAWDYGDQRARATIGLLLEDSKLLLIKNATTAKLCWNALKDHFETVTLTTKVGLLKRLCGMHYAEGEDIQEHVRQMEEIFERLAMAGQELDEDLCVAMVLRSLPDSFIALTTALEARSDDELTLEMVKMKLVDEVARRRNRRSVKSDDVPVGATSEDEVSDDSSETNKSVIETVFNDEYDVTMLPEVVEPNPPEIAGGQEERMKRMAGCKWVRISYVLRNLEYRPLEAYTCLFPRTKTVEAMQIASKFEEKYVRVEANLRKHIRLTEGLWVPETTAKGGGTAAPEDHQALVGALLFVIDSFEQAMVANCNEADIEGQAGGTEEELVNPQPTQLEEE